MNMQPDDRQKPRAQRALAALYRKELLHYFGTPLAYTAMTAFLLVSGYFFSNSLFLSQQASLQPFLDIAPLLLALMAPALSMRLISEEYKSGTMDVLLATPATDLDIIFAKLAALMTVFAALLSLTLAYPVTLSLLGKPDAGAALCAYLGLLLTAFLFSCAGIAASAMAKNQMTAFIIGVLLCSALHFAGKASEFLPPGLVWLADFIGTDSHLSNMARGVIDTRDILYFASLSWLFLFAAQAKLWSERLD